MKRRISYVSNSSSSSFLMCFNDRADFNSLKHSRKGYGRLMSDIDLQFGRGETDESELLEFLAREFDYVVDGYVDSKVYDEEWHQRRKDIQATYRFICEELGLDTADAQNLVDKAKSMVDEWDKTRNQKTYLRGLDTKGLDKLSKDFAAIALDKMRGRWNHLFLVEYEDHTDDGDYMEHRFMADFVRKRSLQKDPNAKFGMISMSNH